MIGIRIFGMVMRIPASSVEADLGWENIK